LSVTLKISYGKTTTVQHEKLLGLTEGMAFFKYQ